MENTDLDPYKQPTSQDEILTAFDARSEKAIAGNLGERTLPGESITPPILIQIKDFISETLNNFPSRQTINLNTQTQSACFEFYVHANTSPEFAKALLMHFKSLTLAYNEGLHHAPSSDQSIAKRAIAWCHSIRELLTLIR